MQLDETDTYAKKIGVRYRIEANLRTETDILNKQAEPRKIKTYSSTKRPAKLWDSKNSGLQGQIPETSSLRSTTKKPIFERSTVEPARLFISNRQTLDLQRRIPEFKENRSFFHENRVELSKNTTKGFNTAINQTRDRITKAGVAIVVTTCPKIKNVSVDKLKAESAESYIAPLALSSYFHVKQFVDVDNVAFDVTNMLTRTDIPTSSNYILVYDMRPFDTHSMHHPPNDNISSTFHFVHSQAID
ncbi:Uncharacterized protein Fot_06442 [Forsythia ovata]|uniref:Uncharacterized protein n=1 Tax=Forsythia ovata TaxID=205694 RepID=A0ABD1WT03_9LAMI